MGASLHVGLVAPPFSRVGADARASVGRWVAALARGLVDRGHRVTLMATGDSRLEGVEVGWVFPSPLWPPEPQAEWNHAVYAATVLSDVDVVHSHCEAFVALSPTLQPPVVHSLHLPPDGTSRLHAAHKRVLFTCASEAQARQLAELGAAGPTVVAPGLDAALYPAGEGAMGDALYMGALEARRAPHLAVALSQRAGLPLRLAGEPLAQDDYFQRILSPALVDADVTLVGWPRGDERLRLLGSAGVLVLTPQEAPPYSLVALEAMLCGTPVVGLRRGGLHEQIDEGLTGYTVDDPRALPERMRQALRLNRSRVRARAAERFPAGAMVDRYVDVYREALLQGPPQGRGTSPATDAWALPGERI